MIIKCESCLRRFVVKDKDIPKNGRVVKCGYCSVTWHQKPTTISNDIEADSIKQDLSVDSIKASDGKIYKFLGSQWAQLLPSGKTGIFAKKKIGKELDKLTGRQEKKISKKKIKINKKLNPSSAAADHSNKLPDLYKPKKGMGFLGYIFLIVIISFSLVGVLKVFESYWISYFPHDQFIFDFIDEQLIYILETIKNIVVITKEFINSF